MGVQEKDVKDVIDQVPVDVPGKEDETLEVECDFSEVSRRWGYEWATINGEVQQWMAVINAEARDDLDDEQMATLEAGRLEAVTEINRLIERKNELVAMVVVHIPREWLVKDAPEKIDWSNPSNLLDFVKDKHTQDLMDGVTAARTREAKN